MMYGVRKTSRFVFDFVFTVSRKSQPSSGRLPRIGIFFTLRRVRSWMRPPMTTVFWSWATICVFTLRFEVVGPSTASVLAISSFWMSIWSRTFPPSLICGLILRRSSIGWRWMGATSELRPPVLRRLLTLEAFVVFAPARSEERPVGVYPAWNGTFWPTTISDSSLSVATRCGVERTFTSDEDCSAWMTSPSDGRFSPSAFASAETGPANPVRNPPSEAAARMFETPRDETRPGSEASGMMPPSPLYL